MRNPAYNELGFSFFISESNLEQYSAEAEALELSSEEIAVICTVLHKLTAIRIMNPTDAEDLVQETLLTVLTKHPEVRPEKGLLVWSMGILRKKVGNYYKKAQRFVSFSEYETGGAHQHRTTDAASPESKYFLEELRRIVLETLEEFPPAQRKAIELLMTGLESGEIVKLLHPESYQNVINHIHRGRKRLAKELAKYGYGPEAGAARRMKKCGKKRYP